MTYTAPKDNTPQYRARIPGGGSAAPKSAENAADSATSAEASEAGAAADVKADVPKETGGPKGPEPTRFGDWERDGRCVDF
ncbi:MAG: DUF1674 domain-containing protein [Alphaproteobacteria bacterium]|nr:DUF1674 domain-containing protein [Alphaproteobacteria bacterium]|tara:strand:+ start:1570 stop:1812 length:243 start_codon:yes stop_codon:yes gene_type:complete